MKVYKFRGRDMDTGKYVYAELGEISDELNPDYLSFITGEGMYCVDSESIAQLIGIDSNGQEVYEGDKIMRIYDNVDIDFKVGDELPYSASFDDFYGIENGWLIKVEKRK